MVTIAKFDAADEAHLEAEKLRSMGIDVRVARDASRGKGSINSPFELQVDEGDLEKLGKEWEERVEEQEERRTQSGSCLVFLFGILLLGFMAGGSPMERFLFVTGGVPVLIVGIGVI